MALIPRFYSIYFIIKRRKKIDEYLEIPVSQMLLTYLSGHDGIISTHGYKNHVVDLGDQEGGIVHITLQDHLQTNKKQNQSCWLVTNT